MLSLTLKRMSNNEDGVFGVLLQDTTPICVTLEDSWKNNQSNISCIPAGIYICKRYQSPRFGETFLVTGVPDRTYILFHWGNTEIDTLGCILVGTGFDKLWAKDDDTGVMEYQPAVTRSRKAFKKFMVAMKEVDNFVLNIIWV